MTERAEQLLSRVSRLMAGHFHGELVLVRRIQAPASTDERRDDAANLGRIAQRTQELYDAW